MTLVDSSVLIDLIEGSEWAHWSAKALNHARKTDLIGLNAIVFAEISRTFESIAAQNAFLKTTEMQYLHISAPAAYAASAAHRAYRINGGKKIATLPDFFIGAHAYVEGLSLITRDATRIKTYFPDVNLISPK